MKRAMVLALIVLCALLIAPDGASAQTPTPTEIGHTEDGWSHRCSSEAECEAWYQWHVKCVHVQRRSIADCDRNFPGAGAVALTPVTVVATMTAIGATGGALLALAQNASVDPNASLDQQKSTPWVTWMAGGAAVGTGLGLFGLAATRIHPPKRVTIDLLAGTFMGGIAYMGQGNAEKERPQPEQEARKESGEAQADQRKAAGFGVLFGIGLAEGLQLIPELAEIGKFTALQTFRDRYPALRRARLSTSINPFGSSRVEVIIR